MPTQYTPLLRLAQPAAGELDGTWGETINRNITAMIEEAIAGVAVIDSWTGNTHTLTTADGATSEARHAVLVLTANAGLPNADAQLICPSSTKVYIVTNKLGYKVTAKVSGGVGVDIEDDTTTVVYCDGTDIISGFTSSIPTLPAFPVGTIVGTTDSQTLTNKVYTAPRGVHVAMGANTTIDLSAGTIFSRTISGATTFTVSNKPVNNQFFVFYLELYNAGNYTVTWWGAINWGTALAPSLSTSGRDVLGFYTRDGGTTWTGVVVALGTN